jgi:hypothetical protein
MAIYSGAKRALKVVAVSLTQELVLVFSDNPLFYKKCPIYIGIKGAKATKLHAADDVRIIE